MMLSERERTLSLSPGPSMDYTVATRLLGWSDITEDEHGRLTGYCPRRRRYYPVPPFSKTFSAAWQIIDHMKRQSFRIRIDESWHTRRPKASFINLQEEDFNAYAATVPEAICKAALLTTVNDGKSELDVSIEKSAHEVLLDRALASGKVTPIGKKQKNRI